MRIDKRLNIVIPIERSDGTQISVHSTPISADVWDRYWEPISIAWSHIMTKHGPLSGPKIADKLLRDVAKSLGVWNTPEGVEAGLMPEIHRLTNVVVCGKRGWETIPYQDAIDKRLIDVEDLAEIEAGIVFFTVVSAAHKRAETKEYLEGATRLWNAQVTLLTCTEYMNSLRTSIATGNSGEKAESSGISSNG